MDRVGSMLKMLRKKNKYSQQYVAEYLGVIRQTYSHYETGRIIPPYLTLHKLAKLYGMPADSLTDLLTDQPDTECTTDFAKLSEKEWTLIHYYRAMDERDRKEIIQISRLKAERKEDTHESSQLT